MATHTKISVDDWVDRFVEHINQSYRTPKPAEEVPSWLRVVPPDTEPWLRLTEYFDWQIHSVERAAWIEKLESELPFPFPPSFRSLVRRYAYPDFTVGPLWILANTGETLFYEMSDSILRDTHLSKILVKHGYLHFARPDTGDYDPVCFDTRRKRKGGEYPVVRIDHEAILCYDRIENVREIAPSFLAFVRDIVVRGKTTTHF